MGYLVCYIFGLVVILRTHTMGQFSRNCIFVNKSQTCADLLGEFRKAREGWGRLRNEAFPLKCTDSRKID